MYDPRLAGPPDPRQMGYLAEGQQGPPMYPPALAPNPAPPVLDTRAMQRPTQAFNQYAQKMRQMAPDPNKQRLAYQIGSVLGPALFGKIAGGSGKQAALYGVGSAAFNYQDQLDRFRKTEADIAAAELQMPGAEQQYDLAEARTWKALQPPASSQRINYVKGANGNMHILQPDGSSIDTGLAYKPDRELQQQQFAPATYQQVQLTDEQGNPYIAMVNTRDPSDIRKLGGAGNATSVARSDKAQEAMVKNQSAATIFTAANDDMIDRIDDVDKKINWATTGPVGSLLESVPGTPAHDLGQLLQTINANIGFDRLQQMRNESQTGGALGQVAVQELEALQRSIASLKQSQSPAQLRKNLMTVKARYQTARKAYEAAQQEKQRMYAGRVQGGQSTSPSATTPQGNWQIIPPQQSGKSAKDYLSEVD